MGLGLCYKLIFSAHAHSCLARHFRDQQFAGITGSKLVATAVPEHNHLQSTSSTCWTQPGLQSRYMLASWSSNGPAEAAKGGESRLEQASIASSVLPFGLASKQAAFEVKCQMLETEELAISKRLPPKVPSHTSAVRRKTSLPDSLPFLEHCKIGKLDTPSVLRLGKKKLLIWAACLQAGTSLLAATTLCHTSLWQPA